MSDKKKIRLLIMDCDGVLSDGKIIYTEDNRESKAFSVLDGLGIKLLKFTDIETAVITGRSSQALTRRCQDLQITHLYQNVRDKVAVVKEILELLSITWDDIAYIGDDWNDYTVMMKAGLAGAPQQAPEQIKQIADFVSVNRGGDGAVREFIEYILKTEGIFEEVIENLLNHFNDIDETY